MPLPPLPANAAEVLLGINEAEEAILFSSAKEFKPAVAEWLGLGNRIEFLDTQLEWDCDNGWYYIATDDKPFAEFLQTKNLRVFLWRE